MKQHLFSVCLILALIASTEAVTLRTDRRPNKALTLVQQSDEAMTAQPEVVESDPNVAPADATSTLSDEQREELRIAGNADVFVMNADGKIEFLGKESETQVQKKMHEEFEKEMQIEEQRELDALQAKDQMKAQPEKKEKEDSDERLVVQEDNMMGEKSDYKATKKQDQNPLGIDIEKVEYPFLTTFETAQVHFYDEGTVEKEMMEAKNCISVFSECDFKGKNLISCADQPSNLSTFPLPIASIYIPEGSQFTMYQELDNMILSFTNSVSCLDKAVSLAANPTRLELRFKDGSVYDD